MAKEQLCRSEAPLSATWWLPAAAYDESSSTGVKVKAGARFRVSASWRRESAMRTRGALTPTQRSNFVRERASSGRG